MRRQDPSYCLNLVECVEKYPCLYDYNLGEYSVRDITNSAWERVADEMKDTADNCRKYWRHLRIVFGRKLKKDPFINNHCNTPTSILHDKMKFLIPFMKINDPGNGSLQRHRIPISFKEEPDDLSSPASTIVGDNSIDYQDNIDIEKPVIHRLNEVNNVVGTLNSDERSNNVNRNDEFYNNSNGYDNIIIGHENKKRKFDHNNSNIYFRNTISDEHQENYRKHYLISLLPDVEEMNSQQFRLFRKKVDEIITEIL